ncbi:MAG: sulfate ABC transporter permease [Tepidisphaeraceae bacterium]
MAKRSKRLGRWGLILGGISYVLLLIGLPVGAVFYNAFLDGWDAFKASITDPETIHAAKLTLSVTALVVPLNALFGLAAAWLLVRDRFIGKSAINLLINLPLAVSPTIMGLMVVLVYSPSVGLLRGLVNRADVQIVFAFPGLVIATLLVTLPLVVREVVPALEVADISEEQAAYILGASKWRTFWRITLPAIRWSLVYGIVLCTAKSVGEFGAVSAVSGHLIGETNTLTLHVERAYADYDSTTAFASATLLMAISLLTLFLQLILPHGAPDPKDKPRN